MRALLAAIRSDVGKVREINEDYTYISDPYPNGLMLAIVADGMGGHFAGEVASKTAVETIKQELHPIMTDNLTIDQYKNALEKAIYKANDKVYEQSISNDGLRGMGTTIVASIISSDWVILAHIGDSRAYLIDDKQIKQLTWDHSLVNELLKNGQITEEEAISHPQKNVITRALGTDQQVEIDTILIHWEEKQTLVFCSDGLTNHVPDEKILEVVQDKSMPIQEAADELLSIANHAGGEDNISIILLQY